MSGGTWSYMQYRLDEVLEGIRHELSIADAKYTEDEIKSDPYSFQFIEPGDPKSVIGGDKEVVEIFKQALEVVAKAQVYIQRCDWFLAGDDGNESLKERLNEELSEIDREIADGSFFKPQSEN